MHRILNHLMISIFYPKINQKLCSIMEHDNLNLFYFMLFQKSNIIDSYLNLCI